MNFQSLWKGRFNRALLKSCALLVVSGLAQGATYYVSTTGSDSNSGTQSAPFRHISHGVAAAHAGDTVIVMNGTYDNEGQVAPNSVVSVDNTGSAGSPITIMAQNRGGAILNAASSSQSSTWPGCYGAFAYFDVSYTSYVVIQGFVIENACFSGFHANGNAHDITIRWNEIKNIGNWNNPASDASPSGILVGGSEYNFTFDGNIWHDIGGGSNVNQQHAIYTLGNNITIINNIFYNQVHGWDIQTASGSNIYIANNTFAFPNPNRDGHIILWDGDGPLSNVVIQNNVFYEPQNYAVVSLLSNPISGCVMQNNLTTVGSMWDNGSSCTLNNNLTGTDPKFMNASSAPYNFHLQSGSPAIDTGMTVPYTKVDMDDWARPVNNVYDRGSYEYHSGSGTTSSITLSANPASLSLVPGGSATSSIAATVTGSASPAFSASGLPSGVAASFSPATCSGSCTTTLTLTASSSAQGSSTVTVTGTSGTLSGSAKIGVSVSSPPPPTTSSLSLSANPTSVSVTSGGSTTSSITATATGSAAPSFSASGLPTGVTASFSPSSCSGSCTTTLTLADSSSAQGSFGITVTATSGSLSASTPLTLSVLSSGGGTGTPTGTGDYTSGLVGEWKLNGTATDSANGDNGALQGGASWSTSTYNGTSFSDLLLDGSSGFVSAGETANLEMTNQLTVSFWARPSQIPSTVDPRIVAKVYDWDVKLNGSSPQFSGAGAYAMTNYSLPAGVWTHIVFTYSSGTVNAYVNGQPVSFQANTFTSGMTLPTDPYGLYIGTDSSITQFYPGELADVRVYNRALGASDVWALYSSVTPASLGGVTSGGGGGTGHCGKRRHCNR